MDEIVLAAWEYADKIGMPSISKDHMELLVRFVLENGSNVCGWCYGTPEEGAYCPGCGLNAAGE